MKKSLLKIVTSEMLKIQKSNSKLIKRKFDNFEYSVILCHWQNHSQA